MTFWSILRSVPLLGILALIYIVIATISSTAIDGVAMTIALPSGAAWTMTTGQLLVAIGLIALYIEILKATRTSTASVIDHLLSVFVFIACLLLFLLSASLGTATFFLITFMALIDVIAGFTVTITAARRDFGVDQGAFND
jgi:hypothetical protein